MMITLFRLMYFYVVNSIGLELLLFALGVSAQDQRKVDSTASVCQKMQRQLGLIELDQFPGSSELLMKLELDFLQKGGR